MINLKNSIESEKDTVTKMIQLYCKGVHASKSGLCKDCRALLDYAIMRLDQCKFGHAKPTCERCTVHCYKPEMRQKIKAVMRYAGPRMIYKHPLAAIRHILKNRSR